MPGGLGYRVRLASDPAARSLVTDEKASLNASCINRGWLAWAGDLPERAVRGGGHLGVRRPELHAVEQIERLGA